jgi:hypothetical protein
MMNASHKCYWVETQEYISFSRTEKSSNINITALLFPREATVVCWMSPWTDLTSHWSQLTPSDWAAAGYISLLVLAVILGNWIFVRFVDSKPEGRKTVLGEAKKSQLF